MSENTTPAGPTGGDERETFAVYFVDPSIEGVPSTGALVPTGETITPEPRELLRKLRERAVRESDRLRELATQRDGVRVVLVPTSALDADPIKARTELVLG